MTLREFSTQTELDAAELFQGLGQDTITLVDVREPVEFTAAHIPRAINLPLSRLQPEQISHLDSQTLVLYCRSGQRSHQASQRLAQAGIRCSQLKGGILAWTAAGYPLEKNAQAPISLFRQVQIVAGSLVVIGTVAGVWVSPWWLLLSGFVGAGLVFAGITDTCALGMLLAKLPYNQRTHQTWGNRL